MNKKAPAERDKGSRPFGEILLEIYGWCRIAASPFFIGVAIAVAIYLSNSTTTGIALAISVAVIGLITGIVWAARIWRKKGTINYISKISESPDLDYLDEANDKK